MTHKQDLDHIWESLGHVYNRLSQDTVSLPRAHVEAALLQAEATLELVAAVDRVTAELAARRTT